MRNVIISLSLSLLSGCTYDYEAAQQRAVADAKQQCESEGKQFQYVTTRVDAEHHDVVMTGHCLAPGDPGYAPPVPSK